MIDYSDARKTPAGASVVLSACDVGKVLTFCAFPVIPLLAPIGHYAGAPWLSPVLILLCIPLLDLALPEDRSSEAVATSRTLRAILKCIPLVYVVTWAGMLAWSLHIIRNDTLAWGTGLWLFVSVGIGSAFATCAAHEMLHWPERLPRAAARLIMATVAYAAFPIEHLHHHAAVGLRHEGTTPPLGQGLWSYIAGNVRHTFASAWRIERERQRRRHGSFLQNAFAQQLGLTVLTIAVFVAAGGPAGLVLFVVQAWFGIYTTEYVNYAQHYGLSRSADEPITGAVSWSSNGLFTNAVTLNITRHADHHVNGGRRYYELRHIPNTPMLPAGYLALFFPAMVPALWRAVMDERARRAARSAAPQLASPRR